MCQSVSKMEGKVWDGLEFSDVEGDVWGRGKQWVRVLLTWEANQEGEESGGLERL